MVDNDDIIYGMYKHKIGKLLHHHCLRSWMSEWSRFLPSVAWCWFVPICCIL
ncbi:hypothetical protein L208DRAFT_1404274 [Tricholoma matsutake]|nr:hypothetical protein L208DRAFT_1404274 [Tricholoma matsutake 945]